MNDEKMMILKMLEEGKISSDEAAKLLEAIKEGKKEPARETTYSDRSNGQQQSSDTRWAKDMEEKVDRLGRSFDVWSRDFGKKMEVLAKDMEPKLQKITQTVVEKTAAVADKISKTLSDPEFANKFNHVVKNNKEKSLEISVSADQPNELHINGKNGMLFVKGYNGDKITAKIHYMPRTDNEEIRMTQLGNRYYLDYDESDFQNVSVEAFVPEGLFRRLVLETSNGGVSVDNFRSEEMYINTSNGRLDLKNIEGQHIKAETTNGKITLENIVAEELKAESANGPIETNLIDVSRLNIETSNASIQHRVGNLQKFYKYDWKLEASNAALKVYVPFVDEVGYEIKANTSLSGVQVGMTGLQYLQNEKNYIEARSGHFDRASRKVKIGLDTSNAPIIINQ